MLNLTLDHKLLIKKIELMKIALIANEFCLKNHFMMKQNTKYQS